MRRLAMRRLGSDDGLTLIETVAALLVFSLIMAGLAAGMTMFAHTTALTKVKNAATSTAQQVMESARSLPVGNLAVCTGGGAPSTYNWQGTSKNVVTGSTPCVPYSSTKTNSGINFTVTQVVVELKTDTVQNQPIIEKGIAVTVAWTTPTPGSYTTSSTMSGNNTITAQTPVGLRININDSTGSLVTLNNLVWDYTVTDSSGNQLEAGTTDDGTSGLLSVSPGTYTCSVVAEDDAGQSYNPGTNAGMTIDATTDTISGSCTVTANNITDWNTTWNEITSCASSGTKGSASITVTDQQGKAISGATVSMTNVNGNANPGNVNTNTSGVALFNKTAVADLYTYSVTAFGYTTASNLGPICVAPNATTTATATMTSLNNCLMSKAKGSVTVTVTDENGTTVGGAKVVLANQDGQGSPGSINTNTSGVALFNANVLGGNYTYTVSKTGYTNLGPQGPFCVAAGTGAMTYVSALLPTSGASGCKTTSTKGTLLVTVTDQAGNPIGNVKVTLKNANGNGGTPGAQNTNTSGVATFNNSVPGDMYTYTVTPPAGYTDPGTQGPICVSAGQTQTSSVSLTGIMTVKVTVTNSDTQPTKSYNIILRDSSSNATTNTTTINRNKSATVTFSSMPTDDYTVEVCVPIASSGNCDDINNSTTVYNFGSKGTTYTVSVTDTKGGA